MVITIDYGHALVGSVGARGCGYKEEVLTREIGRLVVADLRSLGHTVHEIYCDNAATMRIDLDYRTSTINRINPDLSLSIHLNAFNGAAYGVEIFTKGGQRLTEAVNIVNNFVALGFYNRGVKDTGDGLALVDTVRCPKAMLVECGFIDNAGDMARYNARNYANAIVKGITGKVVNGNVSAPSNPSTSTPVGEMYRVRKSWQDFESQKGAFTVLENAKQECDKHVGYSVFNSSGVAVYSNGASSNSSNSGVIGVGSKVKITGSNYATGEAIPSFVKENTYTVMQMGDGKALIQEIFSWVYTRDLQLVSGGVSNSAPVVNNSGSIGTGSKVKITASHYSTGEAIPSSVKENIHTVMQMGNGKALLQEIYSWVNLDGLQLVSGGVTTSTTAPVSAMTVGSRVKIVGSNYVTGEAVPSWVKANTYTIQELSGNKALISEIMSWVYTNDLRLV